MSETKKYTPQQPPARMSAEFVLYTTGDGAFAKVVSKDALHEEMHSALCCCGKPWQECTTEHVKEQVLEIDDPDNWGRDYPDYQPNVFYRGYEDGSLTIVRLSDSAHCAAAQPAPYPVLLELEEWLRSEAVRHQSDARSRREIATMMRSSTTAELKDAKRLAEQMSGRRLNAVGTSKADAKKGSDLDDRVALRYEQQAEQMLRYAEELHRAAQPSGEQEKKA